MCILFSYLLLLPVLSFLRLFIILTLNISLALEFLFLKYVFILKLLLFFGKLLFISTEFLFFLVSLGSINLSSLLSTNISGSPKAVIFLFYLLRCNSLYAFTFLILILFTLLHILYFMILFS